MAALIAAYEKKNVFFIEILGGDEEIPDLDFKRHYGLTFPVIADGMDVYRHIVRVSGITNVAVFGADGVCVFNKAFMEDGSGESFERIIDDSLAKATGPNRREDAFVDGGTVYPPPVSEQGRLVRERTPDLAAGPSGELHVAYSSDESGSSDVLLRSMKGGKWGKTVTVAGSKADEYSPSVVALGAGQALVAWVSNEGGRYDVWTTIVKGGKPGKKVQVTRSKDDAMAPCLARGAKGDVWLSWYEWAKMGELSRDREVLVSRLAGSGWSPAVQVSPREVPTYEDHADPAIASDGKGGVWVAWAWDYHGTLRDAKPPVEENSIFVRHVDAAMGLGKVLAAGFRGEGRARDYAPAIAVSRDGVPWVAWDNSHKASTGYADKAVFLNGLKGEDFSTQTEVAVSSGPLDSPGLLVDPKGGLHAVWGLQGKAGGEVWLRRVGPDRQEAASRLVLEGKAPRHPKACVDTKGNLWVAYTDATPPRWTVRVEPARAR